MPPASKTTGNYANSTLAKMEALRAGYDEAIMLNPPAWSPSAPARTSSSAATAG
jgi:branched-subunit amino acid aminotransferase/4-amino-4-deoxychorismate lyase